MAAKTAKTAQVQRTTKPVRVVKTAGSRSTKATPSFPSRSEARKQDPWTTPITQNFEQPVRQRREPDHGGAALVIQRGGNQATRVSGAAKLADRQARKGKPQTKPKPVAKKKVVVATKVPPKGKAQRLVLTDDESLVLNKRSLKLLTQLVKKGLEGKPLQKRKQYPARNSTIVRVPNELLELVRKQIDAFRARKAAELKKEK